MEEKEICEGDCEGGFLAFERFEIKSGERDFLEPNSEQKFLNEEVVISVKG